MLATKWLIAALYTAFVGIQNKPPSYGSYTVTFVYQPSFDPVDACEVMT